MGSAAKFGLLVLMALVVVLARFLEGEVKVRPDAKPLAIVARPVAPDQDGDSAKGSEAPKVVAEPTPPNPGETRTISGGAKQYMVMGGDTLGGIAKRQYGSAHPKYWKAILAANASLLKGSPKRLKPGMTLNIPAKDSVK